MRGTMTPNKPTRTIPGKRQGRVYPKDTPSVTVLLSLLLVAVALFAYVQTYTFAFINYDDPIYTTSNQVVKNGLTWSGVVWAFTEGTFHSNYWAPLTWITFLIDSEIYGMHPGGYQVTNVIFHLLNTLLLFAAFVYLTGKPVRSFVLAVIFAIHPLHVESVAWVSERKDMVSTLFWMLTLIAYTQWMRNPGKLGYCLVLVMFVCCLMGKPMGVTLPFVLLLLDFWPLSRYSQGLQGGLSGFWRTVGNLVWEKLPLFFVVLLILPLTIYPQQTAGALKSLDEISFAYRIENVFSTYASQILKTFWPLNLGIVYPYPPSLPLWQPVGSFCLLVAISTLSFKFMHRFPYVVVGWLWYLGTFVPVVGFMVIGPHVTADRYTYIPLIGILMMIIWGGGDLVRRLRVDKKVYVVLILVVIAILTTLTRNQVSHWENSVTIYTHTLAVTKANWPVHFNLGTAYREKGWDGLALAQYRQAQRIKPDVVETQLSVGDLLVAMGRNQDAIEHYFDALNTLPGSAAIHTALAIVLDDNGANAKAIHHFQKAIEIDANFTEAHHGLGVARFRKGQVGAAIAHYRKALQIDRTFHPALCNLGIAFMSKGEFEHARTRFLEAISLAPDYAEAYYGLGVMSLKEGDPETARHYFTKVLRVDPNHEQALKGLQLAAENR